MIFIDACFKRETEYTPVWMMRQAGRYLSEYREVRAKAGSFLNLCKNPKLASEVSLQPVDILGVDAAIIFSDILVIPHEMGMKLDFIANEGPIFSEPISNLEDLEKLDEERAVKNLTYVYDALSLTREKLAKDKALIGFCGAPWTLATYMIEGKGSKTYNLSKKLLYTKPELLHAILAKLTRVLKFYLEKQIKAGANALQIFDSWAAALEEEAYLEFALSYINEIVAYLKAKYPEIPIIVFPKGISGYLDKVAGEFDVFGVDWSSPIALAKSKLGQKFCLQGNLEPTRLYSQKATKVGIEEILNIMKGQAHIMNLGHGILPDIPLENAKFFVNYSKEYSKKLRKS